MLAAHEGATVYKGCHSQTDMESIRICIDLPATIESISGSFNKIFYIYIYICYAGKKFLEYLLSELNTLNILLDQFC